MYFNRLQDLIRTDDALTSFVLAVLDENQRLMTSLDPKMNLGQEKNLYLVNFAAKLEFLVEYIVET